MSFPRICPSENVDIQDIATKFEARYPDIKSVFDQTLLPMNFEGESDQPMHSCWLSLFDQNASCLAHVVTETVFSGRRHHLTEKTFKPICLQMPFVLVSTYGSLEYLRSYGFQTFDSIWDESYDQEIDDYLRIEKIARLLKDIDDLSSDELQRLYHKAKPIIEHNYNHFYGGGFEQILWQELTIMLESIEIV